METTFGLNRKWNALQTLTRKLWDSRMRAAVMFAEVGAAIFSFLVAVESLRGPYGSMWAVQTFRVLPYVVFFRLSAFLYFGAFKTPMRYASIADLLRIAQAVAVSTTAFAVFALVTMKRQLVPAVLFGVDALVCFLLLCTLHFGFRAWQAQKALRRRTGKRVIILGAGDAGATVLRELAFDSQSKYLPVAILDDDPSKQGTSICSVPVVGDSTNLAKVVAETAADEILICIPSATRSQMRRILKECRDSQIPVRTLPSIHELIGGNVSQRDFRRIRLEDVLQREEISYDREAVAGVVRGRVVLVTGAGGTIGSELCRQIAAVQPKLLVLLDKSENSLFYTHLEIMERQPGVALKPVLADVAREEQIRRIVLEEQPEVIFHAAAHKHVGLMELHPKEAIRNNVIGTRNLSLAALDAGVTTFVNISTDKAVAPRNYMGLSKKITELLVQECAGRGTTKFMNVRFGNVAGSTGSVLRIFWEQGQKGAPLRVTDPSATRYFMSVSEAVYLIFRAAALGQGGETFILEMGEPVNIYELARTVSLFSGFIPEEELPIEFIGLRHGEKLHEELWEEWEKPLPTEHGQILMISQRQKQSRPVLQLVEELEQCAALEDMDKVEECLRELVPSFAFDHAPTYPVTVNANAGQNRSAGTEEGARKAAAKLAALASESRTEMISQQVDQSQGSLP